MSDTCRLLVPLRLLLALSLSLAVAADARVALAQQPCPRAFLPAYAHNDYENPNPLTDALRLGYRGVEVDVFLVGGSLRLGHDRKRASVGPSFEETYLKPLRALVARCGVLTENQRPFLLTIELKEQSRETFDALMVLLDRYADIWRRAPEATEVVLVGWHPPAAELSAMRMRPLGIQHMLTTPSPFTDRDTTSVVRLVSVDYGKSVSRWWRWRTAASKRKWLSAIRATKASAPHLQMRAYNVPADPAIYRQLLDAGVDLIGTKTLGRSSVIFRASLSGGIVAPK